MRAWTAAVAASVILGAGASAQSICVEGDDVAPEDCTLVELAEEVAIGGGEDIELRYPTEVTDRFSRTEGAFFVLEDASGRVTRVRMESPRLQALSRRKPDGGYEPAMREGRRLYRLTEDYPYVYEATCELIVVPENYVTDLVSVPRLARLAYAPSNYPEAAVVHDWLYAIGESEGKDKADLIFQQILVDFGNGWNVTQILYGVVAAFGGYPHKEDYLFWNAQTEQSYLGSPAPETGFSWLGGSSGACGLGRASRLPVQ